jgi:hypothetical protein
MMYQFEVIDPIVSVAYALYQTLLERKEKLKSALHSCSAALNHV